MARKAKDTNKPSVKAMRETRSILNNDDVKGETGTFEMHRLPSGDYRFTVEIDGHIVKGLGNPATNIAKANVYHTDAKANV
jgi:hypothetical protein